MVERGSRCGVSLSMGALQRESGGGTLGVGRKGSGDGHLFQ
jgi:hypothetical protein